MELKERTEQAIILDAELTFLALKDEFLKVKNNTNTKEKLFELCKHFYTFNDNYGLQCCEKENMFDFMYKNIEATIWFDETNNKIFLSGSINIKYGFDQWLDEVSLYNVE